MVAVERAREAAHRAGDDERGQPIEVRRDADGARARLVRLRRAQHDAEARVDDAVGHVHRKQHQHQHQVIELDGIVQVHEPELAAALQAHAVVAAELGDRDAEVVQHLREGERDHDEVDAARADRHRADGERDERRRRDRDEHVQPAVEDAVEAEDADRIGADADVGGVAEGDEAAVAEDQVEAHRGDGEDHDPPREVEVERLADGEHERRQRHQD